MAYRGKYYPSFPRKYKGDPTNIIYRSLWERKFMVYCDKNTKILEWGRIASYLEQSTRYIYYDQKIGNKFRYITPPELNNSNLKKEYEETMDTIFETYSKVVRSLVEIYKIEFPKEESVSLQAYPNIIP